jgi:hypothetical protein
VRRIGERLAALDLQRTAAFLAAAIVLVGIVGIVTFWLDKENPWSSLDAEVELGWPPSEISLALPALWAGATCAFAGLGWLVVGWLRSLALSRPVAMGFGLLLLFFALDDVFKIHERLESRTGIDWQTIYLPVAAVAGLLLLSLVWQLRDRSRAAAAMVMAGGLAWAVAAVLELLQWEGDEEVESYALLMVPEELLELAGIALFALAAIAVLQSWWVTAQGATGPAETVERTAGD